MESRAHQLLSSRTHTHRQTIRLLFTGSRKVQPREKGESGVAIAWSLDATDSGLSFICFSASDPESGAKRKGLFFVPRVDSFTPTHAFS